MLIQINIFFYPIFFSFTINIKNIIMIKFLKKHMPNIYKIIVAIAICIWFDGINMITHSFLTPSRNVGILFCCISLFIFIMDDGSLNELHNIPEKHDPNNDTRNKIAAIMSSAINNR